MTGVLVFSTLHYGMYSSLLVASDSPVLLEATCETVNSTDASRSIDRSISGYQLYTCDRSLDINL